jgi:hypothetical protein
VYDVQANGGIPVRGGEPMTTRNDDCEDHGEVRETKFVRGNSIVSKLEFFEDNTMRQTELVNVYDDDLIPDLILFFETQHENMKDEEKKK